MTTRRTSWMVGSLGESSVGGDVHDVDDDVEVDVVVPVEGERDGGSPGDGSPGVGVADEVSDIDGGLLDGSSIGGDDDDVDDVVDDVDNDVLEGVFGEGGAETRASSRERLGTLWVSRGDRLVRRSARIAAQRRRPNYRC